MRELPAVVVSGIVDKIVIENERSNVVGIHAMRDKMCDAMHMCADLVEEGAAPPLWRKVPHFQARREEIETAAIE